MFRFLVLLLPAVLSSASTNSTAYEHSNVTAHVDADGSVRDQLAARVRALNVEAKVSALHKVNAQFNVTNGLQNQDGLIYGVNIGGWLVLEPWITPSLFDQFQDENIEDQWHFCKKLGQDACRKQLKKHWASWFTEDDVKQIAAAGLTHVRIPVGYWIFGDIRSNEPWVTGELDYLYGALDWCSQYGIKVVLDLHTGPGSQNGFDNSGKKGEIHWADVAYNEKGEAYYPNIDRTLDFLGELAKQFASRVWAIEILNEPFITIDQNTVKSFYERAYWVVRSYNSNVNILVSDAFRFGDTQHWMQYPTYQNVYLDTHIYQVFSSYFLEMSWDQHMGQTCGQDRTNIQWSSLWTITGEWSLATTDCALWLNGHWSGSRYDGTFPGSSYIGSCDNQNNHWAWDDNYKKFLRKFAEKQMIAYETGNGKGWFFWNWKVEGDNGPQWNYQLGVQQGWIPVPPNNRQHTC